MIYQRFRGRVSRAMLRLLIGLIVISIALFVIGVVLERSGGLGTASSTTASHTSSVSADPDGGHDENGNPSLSGQHLTSEAVFGLDLENSWFVGAFVLGWLVLIAALVRFGRPILLVILLVAIASTILDGGEITRQVRGMHGLLATFAVLVALTHLALAALTLFLLIRGEKQQTATQA